MQFGFGHSHREEEQDLWCQLSHFLQLDNYRLSFTILLASPLLALNTNIK